MSSYQQKDESSDCTIDEQACAIYLMSKEDYDLMGTTNMSHQDAQGNCQSDKRYG